MCSSLISHFYRKNIREEHSGQCGVLETACHFFFDYPSHAAARARYLPKKSDVYTLHDLLFGMEIKSNQENEELFINVQEIINSDGSREVRSD